VGVGIGVGTAVGVGVGTDVGTAVGVGVGTAVAVGTGVGLGTGVGVGVGRGVGVGTAVGVGTDVGVGYGVAVGAGVGVGGLNTNTDRVALLLPTLTYNVLLPRPIEGTEIVFVKVPPTPTHTHPGGFTDVPPIVISSTQSYGGYPVPVTSIESPG